MEGGAGDGSADGHQQHAGFPDQDTSCSQGTADKNGFLLPHDGYDPSKANPLFLWCVAGSMRSISALRQTKLLHKAWLKLGFLSLQMAAQRRRLKRLINWEEWMLCLTLRAGWGKQASSAGTQ